MPSLYQDRWNRIYGNDSPPLAPSPISNEPPLVQAARLRGMARGLVAKREQEAEQRKYSDMMAQRVAEFARRERDDQLASDREERIARQFRENQRRLEEADADRLTHQRFLERMAVTQNEREAAKAARAEEEAARIENERKQFEPVYRTAMGETGHGVTMDKDFNATITVDGKPVTLRGPLVLARIKKLYGEDVRLPKEDNKVDLAATRSTISDLASQSGLVLKPSQINDISRVLAENPERIDAIPEVFKQEAEYQKQKKDYEGITKALAGRVMPKSAAEQLKERWFFNRWGKQDPTVSAITGYSPKGTPLFKDMPLSEAYDNGYIVVTKDERGGILLDDEPLTAPTPTGPILQRLMSRSQGAQPSQQQVESSPSPQPLQIQHDSAPDVETLRKMAEPKMRWIKNDEEYYALPPGTDFIDPEGNQRRKP